MSSIYQEKQNTCLRLLAGAIRGVAHAYGAHVGDLGKQVDGILGFNAEGKAVDADGVVVPEPVADPEPVVVPEDVPDFGPTKRSQRPHA
jgi:hypothetical protein